MPKYDTVVNLADTNDSHSQLVFLVGGNKRVLDVGCATGYVAKELASCGCTVSGVDVDADAAELARPYLQRLVIGDVETLDFVAELGDEQFDAIVFGDVLEHLRDPVAVLRRIRPTLAPGGSVVASIPNVAHGDVRLALLKGRWEYRPLGLLDETHLRFFTRSGIEKMLWEAGFVSVETRRIVADLFTTEVGIRPDEFDDAVVARLREDPEVTTYQFVLRALPHGGDTAIRELREREEEQRIRILELERAWEQTLAARGQLAERVHQLEAETTALRGRLSGEETRRRAAESELQAVLDTRVMRWTRLPRRVFGALLGLRVR